MGLYSHKPGNLKRQGGKEDKFMNMLPSRYTINIFDVPRCC